MILYDIKIKDLNLDDYFLEILLEEGFSENDFVNDEVVDLIEVNSTDEFFVEISEELLLKLI